MPTVHFPVLELNIACIQQLKKNPLNKCRSVSEKDFDIRVNWYPKR